MNYDIDIVVTWVDQNDPVWQKEYLKYAPSAAQNKFDTSDARYRDWGLLKYWFRGIEKFAPWVRYIHFVTFGHLPEWLDTGNPKLRIVRHEDYIPQEYLPLFNSNPIELMMHRIPDLAEHFVYFNDDLYLTRPVAPEYFFKDGLPCDAAVINITQPKGVMKGIMENNMSIINSEYRKFGSLLRHPFKWIHPKYKKYLIITLRGLLSGRFYSPCDTHSAVPYLKSTREEVWSKYGDQLKPTMSHRFRSPDDVSLWVFRYWQLFKGDFVSRNIYDTAKGFYGITSHLAEICDAISFQKYCITILNDADNEDVEKAASKLVKSFEKILPVKSSFEKE